MNKDYLPFYNSLNDKDKAFWMECTKEELIDHLISNIKNGEELLSRIDKSINYIKCGIKGDLNDDRAYTDENALLDILQGSEKE